MADAKGASPSVLLVNCWHDSNKGDAAISIGVINAIKNAAGACRIRAASYMYYQKQEDLDFGFRHVRAAHPDVEFIQTSLPAAARTVGNLESLKLSIRGVLKLLAPNVLPDLGFETALRESRVVVSNGGLYFGFAQTGLLFTIFHLYAFSYPLLLAKRCGIPYVLYAQSFGPFRDPLSRWWMKHLVAGSAGAWARESFSRDALLQIGAPEDKLAVVADAAFGLKLDPSIVPAVLERFKLYPGGYVAISVRGLGVSGHSPDAESRYRNSIAELIGWLTHECRLQAVLVAHTIGPLEDEDDRVTCRAILGLLPLELAKEVLYIETDLSPEELAGLYGFAKFTLATRFHAVVLAICGGAPAIAIPYFGLKTQGSLRDMSLGDLLLEVSDLTLDTLKEKCLYCLNQEDALKAKMIAVATERYAAAMQTGKDLNDIAVG